MDALDELRRETARYGYGLRLGCGASMTPSFAAPEHGVLVVGPPRSGKTSSLVVPNVLSACGAVVTTSTKDDVLSTTVPARRRLGECLVFDPAGLTPLPKNVAAISWSPIESSLLFDQALLTAEAMVLAARPGSQSGESYHWTERAQALLAPAFHAAALAELPMGKLLSLVDRRQGRELLAVLSRADSGIALDTFEGVLKTEERELSGIWSTAASVLAAYRSESALASASGRRLDLAEFVTSGDTLYVCSGSENQRHAAPIVSGLLRDARVAGFAAAQRGELGAAHRRPPLVFLLDEVANIAPLHDLPALVTEGGSQGVVTMACLQDLSQATARWGRLGEGFLSLFNSKVVFPGVGDRRTLEAISLLAGDYEVPTVSRSEGPRLGGLPGLFGARAPTRRTVAERTTRRLPADLVARGIPGHLLCIDGATPSFVEAVPWFEHELLKKAVFGRSLAPTSLGDGAPQRSPRHLRSLGR